VNKDQIKGNVKKFVGKVQTDVGRRVGSTELQVKGLKLEIDGISQKAQGDEKWSRKRYQPTLWEFWA
jgi:uncharacterized protein YjbJ (UPF0337 family)